MTRAQQIRCRKIVSPDVLVEKDWSAFHSVEYSWSWVHGPRVLQMPLSWCPITSAAAATEQQLSPGRLQSQVAEGSAFNTSFFPIDNARVCLHFSTLAFILIAVHIHHML